MLKKYILLLNHKLLFCGINHKRQWSTLEQDNNAPEMPICITNLIEPKRHWADPSKAKLYVCSIPNIKIYLAVVDWSQRVNSSPYFHTIAWGYIVLSHVQSFHWSLSTKHHIWRESSPGILGWSGDQLLKFKGLPDLA